MLVSSEMQQNEQMRQLKLLVSLVSVYLFKTRCLACPIICKLVVSQNQTPLIWMMLTGDNNKVVHDDIFFFSQFTFCSELT